LPAAARGSPENRAVFLRPLKGGYRYGGDRGMDREFHLCETRPDYSKTSADEPCISNWTGKGKFFIEYRRRFDICLFLFNIESYPVFGNNAL
jgi:hypothetical protein